MNNKLPQRTLRAIVVALGFATGIGAGTPAVAQNSATATLRNFTFTLIDLNPDDGITPYFYLSAMDQRANVSGFSQIFPSLFDPDSGQFYPDGTAIAGESFLNAGWGGTSAAFGSAFASADASAGASPGLGVPGAVTSSVEMANVGGSYSAAAGTYAHGNYHFGALSGLVISPMTAVRLNADAEVSATLAASDESSSLRQSAYATTNLHLGCFLCADQPTEWAYSSLELGGGPAQAQSFTQGLQVSWANNAPGREQYLDLWAQTAVSLSRFAVDPVVTSPVPEPSALGLLMLGLIVLAGVAKQERRARSVAA